MNPVRTFGTDAQAERLRNARLLRESKRFAREIRWLSWLHLWTALILFLTLIVLAGMPALSWLVRVPASVLAGFVLIRLFILYHDHQHGTILKGSRLADGIMRVYGLVTLNPSWIWSLSHNHHHKHNAKILGAAIGSYPVMTVGAFGRATRQQRMLYTVSRHPLTIAAGYLTVFLYGMCIRSLLINPAARAGSALAIAAHGGIAITLGIFDPASLVLVLIVPCTIGGAAGAYLFYAQHNYPQVVLHDRARWDYVSAALESSSFIRMGRLMHWFTGNIGYHHVHHLNARIPFYRLPEAMAGLPELQSPGTTSLSVPDIIRCLRLKLWDPAQNRLVGFSAARG